MLLVWVTLLAHSVYFSKFDRAVREGRALLGFKLVVGGTIAMTFGLLT